MTPTTAERMDAIAADPRGGQTTTMTRTVPRGTPGAYATERGTRWEITCYLTPYQVVAETVAEILAGRPAADPQRAEQLVAAFDATADLSPAHAVYVAAVHNIALDNPYPADPLATYSIAWPIHEAFEGAFPRPATTPAPRQTACRHGVPHTDDCTECED